MPRGGRPVRRGLLLAGLGAALGGGPAGSAESVAAYTVAEDEIPRPLTAAPGDPARGEDIVRDRELGNCLICHALPIAAEPFQGTVGPDLAGLAGRLTAGQMRLRVVDATLVNADSAMPAYHRIDGLERVADEYRGKAVLSAAQVEDVVAYLLTLRAPRAGEDRQ